MTVTTLDDENDGVNVGGVSLREAIAAANSGDTIDFSKPDEDGVIRLVHGQLEITKSLTIVDPTVPGMIAVNGDHLSRVFHIEAATPITVELRGLTIERGKVSDGLGGGGVYVGGPVNLKISRCHLGHNESDSAGGAIKSALNSLIQLQHSSLCFNRAASGGGGIALDGQAHFSMDSSTIACNHGGTTGGALYQFGSQGSPSYGISHSTITRNRSASGKAIDAVRAGLTGSHTIFSDKEKTNIVAGSVTSNGYNLFGDANPVYAIATDVLSDDPKLHVPMRRGGITYTCAFRPDSPACDSGNPNLLASAAPPTDQRGFARFKDGNGLTAGGVGSAEIDIGSFELGETIRVTTIVDELGGGALGTGRSIREAIAEAKGKGEGTRIALDPALPTMNFDLALGELKIVSALWLDGTAFDENRMIDGRGQSRLCTIEMSSVVTIEGLDLTTGVPVDAAGGVSVHPNCHVNMVDCEISDCNANDPNSSGGGLFVERASAFLFRSSLVNNQAGHSGGGALVLDGRFHAVNSTFYGNKSTWSGGALSLVDSAPVRFEQCTLMDNVTGAVEEWWRGRPWR